MSVRGHSANREGTGNGRFRRSPVLYLLLALALLPAIPGSALVRTSITLDGVFTDWTPVYDDAANCQYDVTGDAGNTNADITLAAAASDSTYLFHYFRRAAATGGAAPTFLVFIDLDGDQRMESTDRVLRYRLTGGNSFSSASLYQYSPSDAVNGDAMGGTIPGTWPTELTFGTPPYDGFGEPSGAQFEGRLEWAALGVPALQPVSLQFAAQQGSTIDYTGVISMINYGVTVEPDRTGAGSAGSTITYSHLVTNTGNTVSRYDLSAISSRGWTNSILDPTTHLPLTYLDLAPSESAYIDVLLQVPANAPNGTRDTLTVRAQHATAGVYDAATDVTTVGPLLVVPDRAGSILPGGTIVYGNDVFNNTAQQQTVTMTATSDHGWAAAVYDAAGQNLLPIATLEPWEVLPIIVKVSVPAGTTLGTVDVATVEARASASVRAKGYDTTTVKQALDLWPDLAFPAGPGTSVLYRHTVVNSTAEERYVDLSTTSSLGWQAVVLAADGSTPLTGVLLDPFGGSAEVVVRVTVPAGTALGTTDITTVWASYDPGTGVVADTATDTTTAARLATFGISGFGTPLNTFDLGDRAYARGMGLSPGSTMTFRWTDPSGALMGTSTAKVDATGIAQSSHNIGTALSGVGTWTVTLLDGTTFIDSVPFYVGYKATISSLAAAGGDVLNSFVTVSSTLNNRGGSALDNTSLTYQMFWDADADGLPGPGDSYIAADGAWMSVVTGDEYSFQRLPISVPVPNGTFPDTWSVSNLDFRQSGTYTLIATWKDSLGMVINRRTMQFLAVKGLPDLSLSLSKNSIDFGNVEPGLTYTDSGVGLTVIAGVDYAVQTAVSGQSSELGLSSSFGTDLLGGATLGTSYTDLISITVPWATDPGAYAGSITYTIVPR